MSNTYLKFGYIITWLLMLLAIPLSILIMYLLVGHLAGFVSAGEWITLAPDGSFKIIFSGDESAATDLPTWNIVILFLRALLLIGVWVFVLWLLQRVISSVESLKTFQSDNISAFRNMGRAFIVLTLISSLTIMSGEEATQISLSISFSYLALAATAFIISEVFREGHELYEQNRLMI